ncbi:TVP38/TMEM64 family protein [Maritalea sp.]|uniref:TVP38/TMEM64 family protein n=1 Tax=Maritalea sp. TaxID=2003361 RepID=UPI003EF695FD
MKNSEQQKSSTKSWSRWVPLAIFGVLIAAIAFSGAYKVLSVEALVGNYEQLQSYISDNFLLAIALYALIYITAVALSFPAAWVLTIAGGIFFGWWLAGFTTIFAASIGASILFWIASSSLGAHLRESAGGFVQKLRAGMQEDAISYMLFLRLVPAFPFTLVNIVPAILGVPFRIFFWTTLAGIAPGTFAYSYAGEGLASLVQAQSRAFADCMAANGTDCGISLAPSDLITTELLIAFSVLGLVSLLPIVIKRLRANKVAS